MNDWANDSVPFAARGFLLALVACLHVAGAVALLRLSGLPQFDEERTVLQARWIEMPPPAPLLLPAQLPVQLPVAQPARMPEQRQALPRIPTPPQPMQPAPTSITVNIPLATPMESSDSHPQTDVATTTAKGDEDYVEPDFNVRHFSNPKPEYPFQSRRLREQGWVKLRVHVTAEGLANEVTLHTSSGFERLDKAAIDAVKRWRFRPAQRAGKAVAGWVVVPVRFELQ
ncbi:MAG: energy transducer TonB [Proteobacteria bacterium]|nr:energy transducer TonB [Pseudomonadota bacterium]MCL2307132.1 energy transducer TonB [Pseudomonadota bacterium]